MTDQILALIHRRAWVALAALVIGTLAMAAKRPAFFGGPLARVPVKHRAKVVLGLGLVAGIIDAVTRGTPWGDAIAGGLLSAGIAIVVHGAVGGVDPHPTAQGELPPVLAPEAADTLLPVEVTPPTGTLVEAHVGGSWGPAPRSSER